MPNPLTLGFMLMKNKTRKMKSKTTASTISDPYLSELGQRVRQKRAIRGLTRKALAETASISERHLANLEHGIGNVSILLLRQIADAFNCSVLELVGDVTTSSPEWLLIREILENRSESELQQARLTLAAMFSNGTVQQKRKKMQQIALVGLRGAGKSSLGRLVAAEMGFPFIELSKEIERVAGCSITEIYNLYGPTAYRRYERRALEESLQLYPEMVLATPGGLVSDPATLNVLLAHCYTIWIKASPEEHMRRVIAQGDFRPISGHSEAMADLKRILESREPYYTKADWSCDTSQATLESSFNQLKSHIVGLS